MGRLAKLDILKGLAILLVVIGHGIIGIINNAHSVGMPGYFMLKIIKECIYSFHMPLFFLIAGFLSNNWVKLPQKQAFSKKAWRLLYPYIIWVIITGTAMELGKQYTNDGLGFSELLKAPVIPFSEFWFLYILFFIHVIYYFFRKVAGEKWRTYFLTASIILYSLNPFLPNIWISYQVFKFTIFFVIGAQLKFMSLSIKIVENKGLSLLIFGISVLFYLYFVMVNKQDIIAYYLFFMTSVTGSLLMAHVAVFLFNRGTKITKSFFQMCGVHSMEIYCSHLLFLAGSRIGMMKIMNYEYLWMILILSILFSLLSCYAMLYILHRSEFLTTILFGK